MRQIKFRARDIETGKYVYAELGKISAEIRDDYLTFITDDLHTVDAQTVEQLIAVDKNGKEVYEGDKVKRVLEWSDDKADYVEVDGWLLDATFEDYRAILDGEIILAKAKED